MRVGLEIDGLLCYALLCFASLSMLLSIFCFPLVMQTSERQVQLT